MTSERGWFVFPTEQEPYSLLRQQHFESIGHGPEKVLSAAPGSLTHHRQRNVLYLAGEETIVMSKCLLHCSDDNNSPSTLQMREEDCLIPH